MLCRAVCGVTACLLTCAMVYGKAESSDKPKYLGPHFEDENLTTCKEFSQNARFNPYSVLDDIWVVFYFFDNAVDHQVYHFYVPSSTRKKLIKKLLDDSVTDVPVNWSRPIFVMKELKQNASSLIVQMDEPGLFDRYPIIKKLRPGQRLHSYEVYFKQTEGGKYLTFMICEEETAYVMARPNDIPRKANIPDEVAKVGFRGRGMSYLYQGHHWMPIPEADEREYPPESFYMV